MNTKKRSITLLGTVALIALAFTGWSLLLSGNMSEASSLDEQRALVEQGNVQLATAVENLEESKVLAAESEAIAKGVARLFPGDLNQEALFESVREAVKKAGLSDKDVIAISTGAPSLGESAQNSGGTEGAEGGAAATAAAQLAMVNLEVTVRATPEQGIRFLKAMERLDRSFKVHAVDADALEGATKTIVVQGTLFMLTPLTTPSAG